MQLGITKCIPSENRIAESTTEKNMLADEPTDSTSFSDINNTSDSISKIKLFMSLFKGRDDVYAKKWENKKKATSGYSPVCLNQWQVGLCGKPKTPCSKCANQLYAVLDEHVIENHLRGSIIAGLYPMLPDETCHFLAIDFDKAAYSEYFALLLCLPYVYPFVPTACVAMRNYSQRAHHAQCMKKIR